MPPFLPESEEQFIEHVSAYPQVWYHYCQAAYLYIEKHGNTLKELVKEAARLRTQLSESKEQLRAANLDNGKLRSIIEF